MSANRNPEDAHAQPLWLHVAFVLSTLAVLGFFGVAIAKEQRRPVRVEQRLVAALELVDRCETCHDSATHSGAALSDHPVERFGCTTCHGGQGLATDKVNAHEARPDWERPLYTTAEREAACGACHVDGSAPGYARLTRGRNALAERGCAGCHEIPGLGQPDLAPALDGLASKLQPAWVRAWLANTAGLNDLRAMPEYSLSDEQIEALVAFLFSTAKPKLAEVPADVQGDADRGKEAVAKRRCATCHRIEGRGGKFAPPLDTVGSKVDPKWLYNYLLDVHRLRPTSRMPGFKLPPAEAADIVAYATETLVPDTVETPWAKRSSAVDAKLTDKGKQLFQELGCRGCHPVAGIPFVRSGVSLVGFGDRRLAELPGAKSTARPLDLPAWIARKVVEPRGWDYADGRPSQMPAFRVNPEEAQALAIAITALKRTAIPAAYIRRTAEHQRAQLPTGPGRALVDRFRCLVCHRVGDQGGDVSKVPLDGVASRLQRPWLDKFLSDPITIRMEQAERMPVLGIEPEEATRLANWLESSQADARIVEQAPAKPEEVAAGRELYQKKGCSKCHVAEGQGEIQAPVLDLASARLRYDYVLALLSTGKAVAPEARHPDDKHTPAEARALAAYVMSLAPPAAESAEEPSEKPPKAAE